MELMFAFPFNIIVKYTPRHYINYGTSRYYFTNIKMVLEQCFSNFNEHTNHLGYY